MWAVGKAHSSIFTHFSRQPPGGDFSLRLNRQTTLTWWLKLALLIDLVATLLLSSRWRSGHLDGRHYSVFFFPTAALETHNL